MDDLERGGARGLAFSTDAAGRAIRFFEERLRLSEGQFEGRPFSLHESQSFKVGSIFGWLRADGTRRFRRAYIEEGKGNGKSPLAGGIGLYGLTADREAGAEIYAAAATKDQANILFRDAVKMRDQSPDLQRIVRASGGPGREYNLAYLARRSFFRPISREAKKTGSGPRPHFALCDEIHEHPDRGVMEMLERGFKFRRQPLLLMITNSGSDRTSICWEEHQHAVKVAAGNRNAKDDDAGYLGEAIDDSTFAYVCALDPGDDPLNDPACWPKANPLLGVTITEDYLRDVVAQAKAMPGKQNGIRRLHFCQWTDAETAWITSETFRPCLVEFDPAQHKGKRVWVGLDLSRTKDITALAVVTQAGTVSGGEHDGKPTYDAWVMCWTPGDTIRAREDADDLPYRLWRDQGWLAAPKGLQISMRHVAQGLAEVVAAYDVEAAAYDRYAFRSAFEPEVQELGLSVEFVEHPQAGTRKGKPTEAMKQSAKARGEDAEGLWMPASLRQLETLILERRIRIQDSPVTETAVASASLDEDRWGNAWLSKDRSVSKIDAAVALCMAVGLAGAYEAKPAAEPRIRFA